MPPAHNRIWERFRGNKRLLAEHHVTNEEIAFLETVALFGSLTCERDILFVLRNIRLASGTDNGGRKAKS